MTYQRPTRVSLNPCGRLNLTTGKNLHFNILDDWKGDEVGASLTLVEVGGGGLMVIGGWGGLGEERSRVEMYHGQTGRYMNEATVLGKFPCTAAGLAEIKEGTEVNSIRFATLD